MSPALPNNRSLRARRLSRETSIAPASRTALKATSPGLVAKKRRDFDPHSEDGVWRQLGQSPH
jgi:hypothetical protein